VIANPRPHLSAVFGCEARKSGSVPVVAKQEEGRPLIEQKNSPAFPLPLKPTMFNHGETVFHMSRKLLLHSKAFIL